MKKGTIINLILTAAGIGLAAFGVSWIVKDRKRTNKLVEKSEQLAEETDKLVEQYENDLDQTVEVQEAEEA